MARNSTTIDPGEGGTPFDWIDVTDADQDDVTALTAALHLPPAVVDQLRQPARRPHLTVLDDVATAVIKTAEWDADRKTLQAREIRVVIARGTVVTVDRGTGLVAHVRDQLVQHPELAGAGPDVVLALLIAHAGRAGSQVLTDLTDEVTDVETIIFSDDKARPTKRIYRLTREVLEVRRIVGPLPDMIDEFALLTEDQPKALRRKLSQGRRHATHLIDAADSLNNQLTNALQANLTEVSVRQNDDMRRISAYAALAAIPTVIAGVYGMNFRHMPELDWTYGYPAAVAAMLALVTVLATVFRRSGWL